MRVGLNATCFNDRPSGAKQRFRGIYGALIQRRPDIHFVIYEPAECRVASWFDGAPNVSARATPFPSTRSLRKSLSAPFYWPRQLQRDEIDLFEHFYLPLVKAPNCPTILTVHDIRSGKRGLYAAILHRALAKADHVVTVSETMQKEILAFHPTATTSWIYNGIDMTSFGRPQPSREETKRKFALPEEFILSVGHLEVRKNYIALIRAVSCLRKQGRDISLVIVGNYGVRDDREREIREEISRLELRDYVLLAKEVSDQELSDLYGLCSLVAFPSRYEGFGIPVLEAMAARRPLVLSDIPVFREITEGKGAYFRPEDPQCIASKIQEVLCSAAEKERLILYGEARVRDFQFDKLAGQVAQLYARLTEAPAGS